MIKNIINEYFPVILCFIFLLIISLGLIITNPKPSFVNECATSCLITHKTMKSSSEYDKLCICSE